MLLRLLTSLGLRQKKSRPPLERDPRWRRPRLERLEDRTLLAVTLGDVLGAFNTGVNLLNNLSTATAVVNQALGLHLPLVNETLPSALNAAQDFLKPFQTQLLPGGGTWDDVQGQLQSAGFTIPVPFTGTPDANGNLLEVAWSPPPYNVATVPLQVSGITGFHYIDDGGGISGAILGSGKVAVSLSFGVDLNAQGTPRFFLAPGASAVQVTLTGTSSADGIGGSLALGETKLAVNATATGQVNITGTLGLQPTAAETDGKLRAADVTQNLAQVVSGGVNGSVQLNAKFDAQLSGLPDVKWTGTFTQAIQNNTLPPADFSLQQPSVSDLLGSLGPSLFALGDGIPVLGPLSNALNQPLPLINQSVAQLTGLAGKLPTLPSLPADFSSLNGRHPLAGGTLTVNVTPDTIDQFLHGVAVSLVSWEASGDLSLIDKDLTIPLFSVGVPDIASAEIDATLGLHAALHYDVGFGLDGHGVWLRAGNPSSPNLGLTFGVTAGVQGQVEVFGFPLAEAGGNIGFNTTPYLTLTAPPWAADPSKVYVSDLALFASNPFTDMLDALRVGIQGAFTGEVYASIDLFLFSISWDWGISIPVFNYQRVPTWPARPGSGAGGAPSLFDTNVHQSGGILTFTGTAGNDSVSLSEGSDAAVTITWAGVGKRTYTGVSEFDFNGGGGNNRLTTAPGFAIPIKAQATGDDYLQGGAGRDTLRGGPGNDTLVAGSGDDLLVGGNGSGTELIIGGPGHDTLTAGSGTDTIIGGSGDSTINGGPGNDSIYAGSGNDLIQGGSGTYFIDGGTGSDVINAGSGSHNKIYGGTAGRNVITGSAGGFDTIYGGGPGDVITGGAGGNDTIYASAGPAPGAVTNNVITGGSKGNNLIFGGGGGDVLAGGSGNNTIYGGSGNETLYGGDGKDLQFDSLLNGLMDAAGDGQSAGSNLLIAGSGNDVLYGDSTGHNTVQAGAGNDTLYAGTGGDYLVAGPGTDALYGGPGNDTLQLPFTPVGQQQPPDILVGGPGVNTLVLRPPQATGPATSSVPTVNGHPQQAAPGNFKMDFTQGAGATNQYLATVADLDTGSAVGQLAVVLPADVANVALEGGPGDNWIQVDPSVTRNMYLYGGPGRNTLMAGSGSDTLVAGPGTSVLYGGSGDDLLYGGDLPSQDVPPPLSTAGQPTQKANPTEGHDTLIAGAGNCELYAGTGGDVLIGGSVARAVGPDGTPGLALLQNGQYQLIEGAGRDLLVGSSNPNASDLLIAGPGGPGSFLQAGAGNDILVADNYGSNILVAGSGNDTLLGGNLDNVMIGGTGNVTMVGGLGSDKLLGGSGKNVLYASYNAAAWTQAEAAAAAVGVHLVPPQLLQGDELSKSIQSLLVKQAAGPLSTADAATLHDDLFNEFLGLYAEDSALVAQITKLEEIFSSLTTAQKQQLESLYNQDILILQERIQVDYYLESYTITPNTTLAKTTGGFGTKMLIGVSGTNVFYGDPVLPTWMAGDGTFYNYHAGDTVSGGLGPGNTLILQGDGAITLGKDTNSPNAVDVTIPTQNGGQPFPVGNGVGNISGIKIIGVQTGNADGDTVVVNFLTNGVQQSLPPGLTGISVQCGSGNNDIIDAVNFQNAVTLRAGSGSDVIAIGASLATGSDIEGNNAGQSELHVVDTVGHSVTVNRTTGLTIGGSNLDEKTFSTFQKLVVIGGPGNNSFTTDGSIANIVLVGDKSPAVNTLTFQCDDAGDTIHLAQSGSTITVTGSSPQFGAINVTATNMTSITVHGGAGNDLIDASQMIMAVAVDGGTGQDALLGGFGSNTFSYNGAPGNLGQYSLTGRGASAQPIPGTAVTQLIAGFTDSDAGATDTATIAWGDGTTSAGTITPTGGGAFTVTASHIYAGRSNPTIYVTAVNSHGAGLNQPVNTVQFALPDSKSGPFSITNTELDGKLLDGNLWFTERWDNRVGRIGSDGSLTEFPLPNPNTEPLQIITGPDRNMWYVKYEGLVGRITTGLDGVNPPGIISEFPVPGANLVGIAAAAGDLWVTDQAGYSIYDMDRFGHLVGSPFVLRAVPWGITADADGKNLWFTERYVKKIGRLNTSTRFIDEFAGLAGSPTSIVAGPDGNLWFTTDKGVGRITPAGVITEYPLGAGAGTIVVGPDGELWFVAGPNLLGRFTPAGISATGGQVTRVPVLADSPGGITAGPDGELWFTDFANGKIEQLTLPAETAINLPQPGRGPFSITNTELDGKLLDGNLWFTERWDNQVGRIGPDGSFTEFPLLGPDTNPPSPGTQPLQIITGPDRNMWYVKYEGLVGRITTGLDGVNPPGIISEFPVPGANLVGIAGAAHNLWVTDQSNENIYQMDVSGNLVGTFNVHAPHGGPGPWGITAGADGNLWFTERSLNLIGRLNPSTRQLDLFPAGLVGPSSIMLGPDNKTLWFGADMGFGRITPGDPGASPDITRFPLPGPAGSFAAGPDGDLWFVAGLNLLGRTTAHGTVTVMAVPVLDNPASLTTGPDGNLWFADFANGKIDRLSLVASQAVSRGLQLDANRVLRSYYGPASTVLDSGVTVYQPRNSDQTVFTVHPDANDSQGTLWAITGTGPAQQVDVSVVSIALGPDGILYALHGGNNLYGASPGTPSPHFIESNVQSILADNSGTLYKLSTDGKLFVLQGSQPWTRVTASEVAPGVASITPTADGSAVNVLTADGNDWVFNGLTWTFVTRASLALNIAGSVTAGQPVSVTLTVVTPTAVDPHSPPMAGYTGQVKFADSDSAAVAAFGPPPPHPFTAADNGVYQFNITFLTSGPQTLTATDANGLTTTATVLVTPASAAVLSVDPPSVPAGSGAPVTVTAYDAYGNVVTGYTGTVKLSPTTPGAAPTTSYTFTSTSLTGNTTAGTNAITGLAGTGNLAVGEAVTGPGIPAGATIASILSASTLTISGSATATGSAVPLTFGDQGMHTFNPTVTLAGSQKLVAADTAGTSTVGAGSVFIAPAAVDLGRSSVSVALPTVGAGGTELVTVMAIDQFGNPETGGGLTVEGHFAAAGISGDFGPLHDNGDGTYSALYTAPGLLGNESITAKINNQLLTSSPASLTIVAGTPSPSASTLSISPASVSSGGTATVTLTAVDAFGNVEPAGLPVVFGVGTGSASGTFATATYAGNGVYTATFTGTVAGTNTITATVGGVTLTSKAPVITVTAAAGVSVAQSLLTVSPASIPAGTTATVTLTARDAAGNQLTTGGLSVAFGLGTGTGAGTLGVVTDHGDGTYTATFTGTAAGRVPLTATINGQAVTSTVPTVTVTAGRAAGVALVTNPQTLTAGFPSAPLTVQLEDTDHNEVAAGPGGLLVQLSTDSPGGTFLDDRGQPLAAPVLTIPAGSASVTFEYQDSQAGAPTLVVAGPSLAEAVQQEAVLPAGAAFPVAVPDLIATAGMPFNGPVGTFTVADPSVSPSAFRATIAWGDGQTSVVTPTGGSGSFTVNGVHTYAAGRRFPLSVTVTRTGGSNTGVGFGLAHVAQNTPPPPPGKTFFVANLLTTSAEYYTNFVTGAYETYLHRLPDAPGLAGWVNGMLFDGVTDEDIEAGFIGSLEYIAGKGSGSGYWAPWVTSMYQDLLGRTPSPAEMQPWVNYLNSGGSTIYVAHGFAASPERETDRVAADYLRFLGRAPTAHEVAQWVNAFGQYTWATNEFVIAGFLGSTEYYKKDHYDDAVDWVYALYADALGRNPDLSGLQGIINYLVS